MEQEFSPQIRRHLASLAETTREEEDWLEELAANARARIVGRDNSVSLPALDREPAALRSRILRQWAEGRAQGLKAVHMRRLRELSEGKIQGRVELPGQQAVVRQGTQLMFQTQRLSVTERDYSYVLQAGQHWRLAERWDLSVSAAIEWQGDLSVARCADRWSALFGCNLADTADTCIVRNARTGDRIRPSACEAIGKFRTSWLTQKSRTRSVPDSRWLK